MQLGTFVFGTVIASAAATEAAFAAGLSVSFALCFGALTAFVAQMLYLALITSLTIRETDGRRAGIRIRMAVAKTDQKPAGTAQR